MSYVLLLPANSWPFLGSVASKWRPRDRRVPCQGSGRWRYWRASFTRLMLSGARGSAHGRPVAAHRVPLGRVLSHEFVGALLPTRRSKIHAP